MMTSRRVQKVAEAIREVVGMAILADLKDPRIQDVTVTYVEVSPDLRHAKVHVSVMGDDARQQLSLHGLRSAAGYLQSKVGQRVNTRYTPRLTFLLDSGVKHSLEISRLLSEVLPAEGQNAELNPATDDEVADAEAGIDESLPSSPVGASGRDRPPPERLED